MTREEKIKRMKKKLKDLKDAQDKVQLLYKNGKGVSLEEQLENI